jgi:acetyltransferase-like isoleucine patch superfamily enzyme
VLSKLIYPLAIIISRIPTTILLFGEHLNFKKVMWREKYKQYPTHPHMGCVWFSKYPNRLNVKHIGKDSSSVDAIQAIPSTEIYIGNNVIIAQGLKIMDKKLGIPKTPITKSELHIGNNVVIGADNKIIVCGGEKLIICDGTITGAGSIVTKSITQKGTYAGVPAVLVNKKTQPMKYFYK